MSEIKVGEYVRLKQGFIGDIVNINDFRESSMKYAIDIQKQDLVFVGDESMVKHSPNIIDLIEVGDYVNGKLIHKVDIRENSAYIYYGNCKTFCDYQIKTVVTKEQFGQMEYKVKE